ncbi:hypothetical protein Tco_0516471 [Tanacetum coccineum]
MAKTTRHTRKRFKDLGSKVKVKKEKAQDQISQSMKEQAYNKDKDQDQDSRTQRQDNLKDLTSGEIVRLKILSRTRNRGL